MPLLNQYAGHHKLDQTLFSRGVDFTNASLFAPLWHPRSKVSPFISFDKIGHSITATGAIWTPPYGYALDAVDDFMTFGDTSTLAWMHGKGNTTTFAWTVIVVMNQASPGGANAPILDTIAGSGNNVGILLYKLATSRKIGLAIANGNGATPVIDVTTTFTYPNNTLYHELAITYDQSLASANALFYLDGVYKESQNKTANASADANSSYAPCIGRFQTSGAFNGIISEYFIYQQRVYSASEITQHYLAARKRLTWANLP